MTWAGLDHWWDCWREHHECALQELQERRREVDALRAAYRYEQRRAEDAIKVLADHQRYIEQLEAQILQGGKR